MREARAVGLAKTDPPFIEDIFQYRLLFMMSATYRLWAKVRLHRMQRWVQAWGMPQIFVGVPGKGADQAWYKVSLAQADAANWWMNFDVNTTPLHQS